MHPDSGDEMVFDFAIGDTEKKAAIGDRCGLGEPAHSP